MRRKNYHSVNNAERYRETVQNSLNYVGDIEKHPRFNEATQLLSDSFDSLSEQQLRILAYFTENHEQLTLVTLEPRLLGILGLGLFLNLYTPMHASGNFTIIVEEAIKKQASKSQRVIESLQQSAYYWYRIGLRID
jgi:hypothetical protein